MVIEDCWRTTAWSSTKKVEMMAFCFVLIFKRVHGRRLGKLLIPKIVTLIIASTTASPHKYIEDTCPIKFPKVQIQTKCH